LAIDIKYRYISQTQLEYILFI